MAPVTVLLNPAAAGTSPHGIDARIATLFAAAGSRANVHVLRRHEDPAAAARAAGAGGAVVAAAGGDGTVSRVASGVIEAQGTLGILPLGTLNHFAPTSQSIATPETPKDRNSACRQRRGSGTQRSAGRSWNRDGG